MIIDEDLIFDTKSKRYYLTNNYVLNKLGTDIGAVAYDDLDTNKATFNKRTIEYACDMVYDYIEENAVNPKSSLFYVTQDEDAHLALKKALGYQLFYFIQNGDASMSKGNKASHTVNNRAIQLLHSKNVFHIRYGWGRIPEDGKDW